MLSLWFLPTRQQQIEDALLHCLQMQQLRVIAILRVKICQVRLLNATRRRIMNELLLLTIVALVHIIETHLPRIITDESRHCFSINANRRILPVVCRPPLHWRWNSKPLLGQNRTLLLSLNVNHTPTLHITVIRAILSLRQACMLTNLISQHQRYYVSIGEHLRTEMPDQSVLVHRIDLFDLVGTPTPETASAEARRNLLL